MDASVEEQTIQWARESLQRRRSELLERKRETAAVSSTETSSSANVKSLLQRGRALLAEVEAHSEVLGQYTSNCCSLGRTSTRSIDNSSPRLKDVMPHDNVTSSCNFMSKFLQESNTASNRRPVGVDTTDESLDLSRSNLASIPTEVPVWEENDNVQSTIHDDTSELGALLQEGDARARLDDLIATVRRRGDDPLKHLEGQCDIPFKTISSFDPDTMNAARRAANKKAKRDKVAAAAEEEARKLKSFKALPLPGGLEVKHDIFAPTQSFQGKHLSTVEKLVRQNTKRGEFNDSSSMSLGGFGSNSVVTSRTSHDNSLTSCEFENEADRHRASQVRNEKRMKKRQLLEAVNRTIMKDMGMPLGDDTSTAYSVHSETDCVEDPAKIRQQIARLETKLKQKKIQRSATLNDIVEIDLNSMFSRLISVDADDDAKRIIDHLKRRACGHIVDGVLMEDFQHDLQDISDNDEKSIASKTNLFRRQEAWAKQREQKRSDARSRIEADAMSDVTWRPQIVHAEQSWMKAKTAHDEALQRVLKAEQRKHQEREERDRVINELKAKEMEELGRQAKSNSKTVKSESEKEDQMKRLEKLARPRQFKEDPSVGKRDDITELAADCTTVSRGKHSKLAPKANIFLPSKPSGNTMDRSMGNAPIPNAFIGLSKYTGKRFSDMNDKEFAKIVNHISKMASKKVKGIPIPPSMVTEDELIIGDPEHVFDVENSDTAHQRQGVEEEWRGNAFVSSSAQHQLIRQAEVSARSSTKSRFKLASFQRPQVSLQPPESDEPYKLYERSESNFFDKETSTDEKGRFRVRDARGFLPETMRKISYQAKAGEEGVTLLVGKRNTGVGDEELVITAIFDLFHFDEQSASQWWNSYRGRFIVSIE